MDDQLRLEHEYKTNAERVLKASYDKAVKEGAAGTTHVGERLANYSFNDVMENIKALFNIDKHKAGAIPAYANTIEDIKKIYGKDEDSLYNTLTAETFNVLLSCVLNNKNSNIILSNIAEKLAYSIEYEIQAYQFSHATDSKTKNWFDKGIKQRVRPQNKRIYARAFYKNQDFDVIHLDTINMVKLACKLIDLCLAGSGYFEYCNIENSKGKTYTSIKACQWLLDTWQHNIDILALNSYKYCPTIIPPKAWTSPWDGGYYGDIAKYSQMVRVDFRNTNIFITAYQKKLDQLDMSYFFNVLNSIQNTAYKINNAILDVAMSILSGNGGLGDIPDTQPIPKLPELQEPYTDKELKDHKYKMMLRYKADRTKQSRLLRIGMTLGCAKKFSQYDKIYFPCNYDYRGRIYPMPTEISPQGDDLQKSLLLFADPTPLDNNSQIDWFYITGANFFGVDKVSFQARQEWIKAHSEAILECADDPLNNTWWSDADDSFLFLSWCMEYKKLQAYLQEHEGSVIGFTTGIPVSFDGTCSGLQHFSALLQDEIGGAAVNLVPAESVSDIYQIVADKVNPILKKDAISGSKDAPKVDKNGDVVLTNNIPKIQYGTKELATEWLVFSKEKYGTDGITRKVCKRSVMTLAYGSKKYGFSENLQHDIINPYIQMHSENPIFLDRSQAGQYLAGLIWDAVRTTVVKAVEGMEWLQKVAKLITKGENVVQWNTPNGLPVQQNKFIDSMTVFKMRFSGIIRRVYVHDTPTEIDKLRQRQAISPNFIHSMDACHMQRVTTRMSKEGINNYWMVHDSFGTDLAHAQQLFTMIREEFVKMYQNHNYLQEFLDDVSYLLPDGEKIPSIPSKGNLDISQIKDSKYCFA